MGNNVFLEKDGIFFKFFLRQHVDLIVKTVCSNKTLLKISTYSKDKYRLYNLLPFFHIFYTTYKINSKELVLFKGFYLLIDLIGLGFRITKMTDRVFFFELG